MLLWAGLGRDYCSCFKTCNFKQHLRPMLHAIHKTRRESELNYSIQTMVVQLYRPIQNMELHNAQKKSEQKVKNFRGYRLTVV
ncbi:hypothetical protein M758_11G163900, partial [Ceratodon purpureus]